MNAPYVTDKTSPAYGRSINVLMAHGIGSQIADMIRQMPQDVLVAGLARTEAMTGLDADKLARLAACRTEIALRAPRA